MKALGGLEKLETLTIFLQKPDDDMTPVLAGLKGLKSLAVGGLNKEFAAKLQTAMPGVKVRTPGLPKG